MKQLHQLMVMYLRDISAANQKGAADYLMFLKQKNNNTIKGRRCFMDVSNAPQYSKRNQDHQRLQLNLFILTVP